MDQGRGQGPAKTVEDRHHQDRSRSTVSAETIESIDRAIERKGKRFEWGHITEAEYLTEVARLHSVREQLLAKPKAPALIRPQPLSPATIERIRALLRHLQRLHVLAIRLAASGSIDEAIRAARPPIFFKQQDSWRRQLGRWSEARLRLALDRVAEAEFHMKQTGLPAETLCREAMFSIAEAARGILVR